MSHTLMKVCCCHCCCSMHATGSLQTSLWIPSQITKVLIVSWSQLVRRQITLFSPSTPSSVNSSFKDYRTGFFYFFSSCTSTMSQQQASSKGGCLLLTPAPLPVGTPVASSVPCSVNLLDTQDTVAVNNTEQGRGEGDTVIGSI